MYDNIYIYFMEVKNTSCITDNVTPDGSLQGRIA